MIELMELRAALRAARMKKFRSAREFAEKAGLSHSTVAKIESLKRKTSVNYDPGVIVVSRYLGALGYGLSDFFRQIERQTNVDIQATDKSTITASQRIESRGEVGGDGGGTSVPAMPDVQRMQEALAAIKVGFGELVESINTPGRQAPTPRPSKSSRSRRSGTDR